MWNPVGYIPGAKVKKAMDALDKQEIKTVKFKTIESPIELISLFKTKGHVVAYWHKDFFRSFIFVFGCLREGKGISSKQ